MIKHNVLRNSAVMALTLVLLMLFSFEVSEAQRKRRGPPLVRDAEIEGLVKDYTRPIFKAAGLGKNSIRVYLVNKREFNAFVTGRLMFINLGAIQIADVPNEIIGVIAHETGHIIGGHLHRLRDRIEKAQVLATIGMLAGVGAAVLGGDAGDAAAGALLYGSRDAFQRSILAYRREEERAADQSAFSLLQKTGQSSKGLLTTFKRFSRSLNLSGAVDPYKVSHPLPRERIALMTRIAKSSPYYKKKDDPQLVFRHQMARAKIAAYTDGAGAVRRLFSKRLNSPEARYGDAIATFLSGSYGAAIPKIDGLIKKYPKYAYFHEMKGEILLKSGRAKAAIEPLRKAYKLDKYKSGIIRISLAHAMLETGDPKLIRQSIKELKAGISRDPRTGNGYELLARAYAATGQSNLALAAAAEHNFNIGQFKKAKGYARRAQKKLKSGSPQWLRLSDIIKYKIPKKRR